jgi:hypothetical protein
MKLSFCAAVCVAVTGFVLISTPSVAQQKTVKQCQDEWRANKTENQAKGIKERDYVTQCRGGAAGTQPTAAPIQTPAAGSPASAEKAKTAKECRAEWQANKADNQAKGITERQYVEQCRSGGVVASPAAASPVTPSSPSAPAQPAPTPTTAAHPPAARTAPTGAGQYQTEGQAKGQCPADTVVWVNLKSRIYHFAGTKNYGTTKEGAYMCERQAVAQGDRASKTEKHP